MIIEIEAYTNISEVYVDVFEFQTPDGELLPVDSDSTGYDRDEDNLKLNVVMEGVYHFDEEEHYLNGQGEMLSKLKIANCRLYFEKNPNDAPWFFIKNISIQDGEHRYIIPKENYAKIDMADDHEQKVDTKPPLDKFEVMIELHSFIPGKDDSKWFTKAKGYDSIESAKSSVIVYLYHLINKYKIKDKLMELNTIYSAYNAISQEEEYADSDGCRVLFEKGMFSFYGEDMEYPTYVQVSLDRTVNRKKMATLLIKDEDTEKFLNSELCGVATAIRELECVDGKIIDSSWIKSVESEQLTQQERDGYGKIHSLADDEASVLLGEREVSPPSPDDTDTDEERSYQFFVSQLEILENEKSITAYQRLEIERILNNTDRYSLYAAYLKIMDFCSKKIGE